MTKVLHYTNVFCPASQTFIRDLVLSIQSRGVESRIAAKEIENVETFNNLEYVNVGNQRNLVIRGIRRILGLPSRTDTLLLSQCIDRFEPDIIHCHFGLAAYDVGLLHKKLELTQKIVVSLHGYDVFKVGNFPRRYDEVLRRLQNNYAVFTAPSDCLKKIAIERMELLDKRFYVVGNGINPVFIEKNQVCTWNNKIKIGCVGRLIELKGQKYLIKAAKLLHEIGISTQLNIIGDGPLKEKLIAYTKELRIYEDCVFYGSLNHDSTANIIKSMNLYVQPSITMNDGQFESFGVALLEAVASGLPVIATNSGGMKEVLEGLQKPFAQIIPEKSSESIASAVIYYIEQARFADIRLYNSKRLEKIANFSIEGSTNKVLALYDEEIEYGYRL